ncbi:hypothetical protein ATER59S_03533 [Aquamicrobium terrae]
MSASLSPTCPWTRTEWYGSTTSAAPPSSTSRKVNTPSAGRGCHAGSSATTRCGYNTTRWPTTWQPCLTPHRPARGHGRLVPHQPATQADQDWGACLPSRPRHHLPASRGCRHWPDGARHPRRHPPPSSASAMRMTAIHARTERKRQDRSARCAEKRSCRARTRRFRGLIRTVPAPCTTAGANRDKKRLSSGRIQANLHVRRHAPSGMSVGAYRAGVIA